ncbi:MAG: polyribonucleotide nucleotidyltransferase [Candidatus Marinimicrobia bacterium]|jgi:polyribonucleotide nucleotidyltransferase|nr:polyribonucleotide nucleotidyltransferase [Candidatus Neomarinimicrobiota bacterium]
MIKKSIEISGQTLTIETGRMAKQASGSVLVTYGETVVLVASTANQGIEPNRGFFPLTIDYREKFYASGKIPGGFFKREARPSEKEIIGCRLTDRPLRPLFPKGFYNETQVFISVLSFDGENNGDILGTIGASASLAISDIPWDGPVASVKVGRINGELIINPTNSVMEESDLSIIISGTKDSVVMVEGEANFISEDDFLTVIQYGHEAIKDIVKLQEELVAECGKTKREIPEIEVNQELNDAIDKLIEGKISDLNSPREKAERYDGIRNFKQSIVDTMSEEFPEDESAIKGYIDDKISLDLRKMTLGGTRADGRDYKTVRDITIETSVLPRTHGSSLFTRGETQSLVVATLGSKRDEQMLDNIEGLGYKKHMLHYNFPPYSVGEARPKFSVSRREIGHGNLAERAIKPSLPDFEDFPYTIRLVSEILESNGSSSMATVCGSSLGLMDAGVPVKAPIAGVAMGLIMEDEDNYAILTDILGTEDHLGDMDFKVAGSRDGITAIQMDLKIDGLPIDLMREALQQAKEGRIHILDVMKEALETHRSCLSIHAPKIGQSSIPVDRIGDFIGPGGKNIKAISAEYECEISVEDDGMCVVMGQDQDSIDIVVRLLDSYNLVPVPGEVYDAEVVRIMDFGAFVKIAPGKEGLVHISALNWEHVKKVDDVVKIGDKVKVKLIKIDDLKRLDFSMKALMEKPDNYSPPEKKTKFQKG